MNLSENLVSVLNDVELREGDFRASLTEFGTEDGIEVDRLKYKDGEDGNHGITEPRNQNSARQQGRRGASPVVQSC